MMFLVRHPMLFIFLNLFDLLECQIMLMTLILAIWFFKQNFAGEDIDILNFVMRFKILSAAF